MLDSSTGCPWATRRSSECSVSLSGVSGVLSSCEAMDMKSSRTRSAAWASRSRRAFSTVTAT